MANRGLPILARLNLKVMAGVAKPNPKMGQSLGPLGINMMHFCKDFNGQTGNIRPDVPLRVRIKVFEDRTYVYEIKPPETAWFLKKVVGKDKLTKFPGHMVYDEVSVKYIYEIAKIKQEMDKDMKNISLESICRCIVGQCSSMGIKVVAEQQKPTPFSPNIKL